MEGATHSERFRGRVVRAEFHPRIDDSLRSLSMAPGTRYTVVRNVTMNQAPIPAAMSTGVAITIAMAHRRRFRLNAVIKTRRPTAHHA